MRVAYNVKAKQLQAPTAADIRAIRKLAGLTQQQSAELVHRASNSRWREWESGKYGIDMAVWELFLLKSGLRPLERN
jgi:DNA-binding transcriptional regulator YiaG